MDKSKDSVIPIFTQIDLFVNILELRKTNPDSPASNQTPVSNVTSRDIYHYTTENVLNPVTTGVKFW